MSLLSLIGGRGGVLPPHFGQKKAGDLFQISCSVCRYVGGGYLIVKVRGKLTRCEADKLKVVALLYFCCILIKMHSVTSAIVIKAPTKVK